jgi:solute carrier family 25 ornithine transporter 2/15
MRQDSGEKQSGRHVVIDFLAGAIGATTSVYVGQPLDTLKVKMQTFPHLYPNLAICFKETLQKEGVVRGLYAGTVPSLAANIAENSILFASYGVCQKLVANAAGVNKIEDLSTFHNGTSGSLAAFFAAFALCPTELVKCRLQAMRESHLEKGLEPPRIGPVQLTGQILKSDGIGGLFRGLTPTFMREMPGYFCFFYAYELSREALKPEGGTKEDVGPLGTMFSGGMAGVTLWTVIFPADVIKSRLQVSGSTEPMLSVGRNIIKNEGFLALYNGLLPSLLRTFPATGALFIAYEYSRAFMRKCSDSD